MPTDRSPQHEVLVSAGAERDMQSLWDDIAAHASSSKADHVLEGIPKAIESLASHPEGGPYPAELAAIGVTDYRQRSFKPYRIIYRIVGMKVFVYVVADGRRDMQSLLMRRLLSASAGR